MKIGETLLVTGATGGVGRAFGVKIYGNDIVDVDLMLMDADTFAFIKPSAVLINTARGPIAWEKA